MTDPIYLPDSSTVGQVESNTSSDWLEGLLPQMRLNTEKNKTKEFIENGWKRRDIFTFCNDVSYHSESKCYQFSYIDFIVYKCIH